MFRTPKQPTTHDFSSDWQPMTLEPLYPAFCYVLVVRRSLLGRNMERLSQLASMRADGSKHTSRDLATLKLLGLLISDADALGIPNERAEPRGQLYLEQLLSRTGALVGLRVWKFHWASTGFTETRTWHRALLRHADMARKRRKVKVVDGNAVNPVECATLVTDPASLLAAMAAYSPPTGLAHGRIETLMQRVCGNPSSVSLVEPLRNPGYFHIASPELGLVLHVPSFLANLGGSEVDPVQTNPEHYMIVRKRKRLAVEEGREEELEASEVQPGEPDFFRLPEGTCVLAPGQSAWDALLPVALRRRIAGLASLGPPFEKRVRFEALTPATGAPPAASGSSTTTTE